jgi:Tfp pilus assembly protein PilW
MSQGSNSLPSMDRTISKKAQIVQLAAAGHSNRQIAAETGTSEGYVAKVKSEAKRAIALKGHPAPSPPESLLLHSSTDPKAAGSGVSTTTKSANPNSPVHPSSNRSSSNSLQRASFINLQETNENAEVRKTLWKRFAEKIPNVEIVKETGLNPAVVWSEFEYFLRFTDRNPYALYRDAMDYLSKRVILVPDLKEIADSYQKLAEKYKVNGYLTNAEFSELLQMLGTAAYERGINTVGFRLGRSPNGWSRPLCSICRKPLGGLIADPSNELGKTALASVREYSHGECVKR